MQQQTRRKTVISAALIIFFLLFGVLVIWGAALIAPNPEREELVLPPITVTVESISRGDFQETLRGFGLAQPVNSATVAAQVRGRIVSLPFAHRVGAAVEEGQVLMKVDPNSFTAEVARREALLLEAMEERARIEAELAENERLRELINNDIDVARAELARRTSLFERGVLSEVERDQAETALRAVELRESEVNRSDAILRVSLTRLNAQLKARGVELEQARIELGFTEPRAPFSGLISRRFVNEGDFVQPGTPLFEILSLEKLELPIEIPASQASALRQGATAVVMTDENPPRIIEGTVERVSPVITPNNRTVSTFIVINQPSFGPPIPPGVFLSANVAGRIFPDVVAIPRTAIVDGSIYVARDGQARRIYPSFFAILDTIALTRDDWEDGTLLITSGFERLFDGSPISLPAEIGSETSLSPLVNAP